MKKLFRNFLTLPYTIFFSLVVVFAWSVFFEIEQSVSASGQIVTNKKIQKIQNRDGGLIRDILVENGEQVSAGQTIIILDNIEVKTEYNKIRSKLDELKLKKYRVSAESTLSERLNFPADFADISTRKLREHKNQFYLNMNHINSKIDRINETINIENDKLLFLKNNFQLYRQQIKLIKRERQVVMTLVKKGLEPLMELVKADRTFIDAQSRLQEIDFKMKETENAITKGLLEIRSVSTEFSVQKTEELRDIENEIKSLEQELIEKSDILERSRIKSPVAGLVHKLQVSTIGEVVQSGATLSEIVPEDSQLLLEARLRPEDRGFVVVGQKADIKLSSYDYSIYGSIKGTIQKINPDLETSEDGAEFYKIIVKPGSDRLIWRGRILKLLVGMTATVDIKGAKRSVFSYISSPVTKTISTSFTEK